MEGELGFNGVMGVSKKGYWKFYYENGNLKMEGDLFGDHSFSNEITESGLWKFYHENGKLFQEGNYTESKREGIWKVFSEEGLLNSKITYENGKIVERSTSNTPLLYRDGLFLNQTFSLKKFFCMFVI